MLQNNDLPHGFPRVEIPNRDVVECARQFRNTMRFMMENIGSCEVLPLDVVASLAIELYLKALNSKFEYHDSSKEFGIPGMGFRVTSRANKSGHDLIGLFDAIESNVACDLGRAYSTAPILYGTTAISEALTRYNGLLEASRYAYENGQDICRGSINEMARFVEFIAEYVERLPRRRVG